MAKRSAHELIQSTVRGLLAGGIGIVLAAATPMADAPSKKLSLQLSESSPLQPQATLQSQVTAAPQAKMQTAMYQAAPMPDPDATGPAGSASPESPSLMPTLLSEKGEFAGEGYSYSSSQQGALHHRTQPAAGLNLSVPVGQQVGHAPGTND